MRSRKTLLPLLSLFFVFSFLFPSSARAQRPQNDLGIGIQIGSPVGLTIRRQRASRSAYVGLAAWDLNEEALFVSGFLVYERPVQIVEDDEPAYLFFGPGAYVSTGDGDFELGASGRVGLSYFVAPFELFVQISPRFNVVPETDFGFGGGLGARYYL